MSPRAEAKGRLAQFTARLHALGFAGDVASGIETRSVFSTDSSVYEMPPLAVAFPRKPEDLNHIASAATACGVAIAARGGGTGTNGQSLTEGVAVDCSRYLTKIEDINVAEGYAIVQPGVILDELNRAAGAHGLFFAPTVSTASRATLGGMAATDASGKGSRAYGRTSDHVLDMDVVLADGTDLSTSRTDGLCADVNALLIPERDEIARVFPVMNRGLTGYNLQETLQSGGGLVKLLCGSEGTLALTKRLKLRLLPKPALRALAVFSYDDMMVALRDVQRLITADPVAIEFIDDKILSLARQDPVWSRISSVLGQGDTPVLGLNFVEVIGETEADIAACLARLKQLGGAPAALISSRTVTDPSTIADLWQLRAKSVGLLGRMDPTRQGTPFVEDAAVPAERLPDFVAGFRAILDREHLKYGMFGHADVGCVHVRPALDMRRPDDAEMIRRVSDQVNALALAHGGLIWGEHGKGFRGEYGPEVFGPRLYAVMCQIKALFDPHAVLNPGKIAMPTPQHRLTPLDAVPFRGPLDAQISPALSKDYDAAIKCNGNGQCMGRDFDDAMCPSYKATGDRTRSPKGRAAMLRQWARMQSTGGSHELSALEAAVYDSLSDCLGCKACASQCPVKVDIPNMRSRFYASYFTRHRRPLMHHVLSMLEPMGPVLRAVPQLSNMAMRLAAPFVRRVGLVDIPSVRPAQKSLTSSGQVVLIADSFLATFDGEVLDAAAQVLHRLGHSVAVSPPVATGKPAHAIGARASFRATATKTLQTLHELAADGAHLVAIEPSFLSMFSDEYAALDLDVPKVTSLDQFLGEALIGPPEKPEKTAFTLFTHCTETAADPLVGARWAKIFARAGLRLETTQTGCCGMAGTFGHETAKQAMSKTLFDLSWKDKVETAEGRVLATGFSCRCQVKRFAGIRPMHPIEALWDALVLRG